jgi:dihydroxyacetone kinase
MGILANHLVDLLELKGGDAVRFYVGSYMTSLEMVGFSITILFNASKFVPSLDASTESIHWTCSRGINPSNNRYMEANDTKIEKFERKETGQSLFFESVLKRMCDVAINSELLLCELDTYCGDGDFGNNFAKAGKNVLKILSTLPIQDVSQTLYLCSLQVQKIGGTSGCVFGVFLLNMSSSLKGKEILTRSDWILSLESGIQGIIRLTGAKLGDRTFQDTLIPAVTTMKKQIDEPLQVFAEEIIRAAKLGTESTKKLLPKKGRASYLGERVLGHVDPGAHSIYLLLSEWSKCITANIDIKQ